MDEPIEDIISYIDEIYYNMSNSGKNGVNSRCRRDSESKRELKRRRRSSEEGESDALLDIRDAITGIQEQLKKPFKYTKWTF